MAGFIDEAQVHVKAGNGGAGASSIRREAHVANGGPDGGNGGRGGDVYLEATTSVASLLSFKDHPHRQAGNGTHGEGSRRHGRDGKDVVVFVPEGTIITSGDGTVLADLRHRGDRLLAAQGGRGGRGNAALVSRRVRAPGFAEQGEVGEERWLDLELKLLADVALVGFPNAGKSTLISTVSAATPKIANYPFTTLEPHLGVVRSGRSGSPLAEGFEFVMADIPGLIEGASEGRGIGLRFLRHIERARVLAVLVDLAPSAAHSPADQVRILLGELRSYRAELIERPMLIVGSRVDEVVGDRPPLSSYNGALEISSATHEGISELVHRLGSLVKGERERADEMASAPVVHRPQPEGVLVERQGDAFVVEGRDARWAVGLSDLTDAQAVELIQRRLRKTGVTCALIRAGARHGDTVVIGTLSFTFEPDD